MSTESRAALVSQGPFTVDAEPDEINSLIESLNRLS
jgi:hypothetical protein